ncbi:hypothetical protein A2303_06785 [Candidatus Falkowbacteria bacterium RIFOXYB2_FULL_47_14]|uniref:DUF4134 domain-containing protein n=1 Tax=Candidatus Falkowbacteria bacterium RIFOXYA2_FULL_47_19 TaxID=1797994 RepID=A0A1F5SG25_9BACT|nr:MAG: hypothetical protein A2227_00530 [Candidatus Falkowbacteria bacterium RIFOXYA2_FULL_47_19]OGF35515.1 MAG: hypothetical protein A2468_05740 [Candidatus Falkowbacteria bacterium RIFOXYC2_FULL_46_15]OGF43575.1 MAG: hypothetical protein A2303_06785 [Candidatus Falkowbacteria bacterium RIFOXYB2_FULL_47_14]
MKKTFFVLALSVLVILPVFAFGLTAHAQTAADNMLWGGFEGNVQTATGLGNTDPREMAGQVVNILLGFLGIIAVVIILLGGFKWMTAAGDEGKVDEAKKLIGAGIIGLVVILAAFAIAQFVISALYNATNATG